MHLQSGLRVVGLIQRQGSQIIAAVMEELHKCDLKYPPQLSTQPPWAEKVEQLWFGASLVPISETLMIL